LKINGQSMPMAFQFSMQKNVPIYQYKQNINNVWLPAKDGVFRKKILSQNSSKFQRIRQVPKE
jgi:hypothetical protein